MRYLILTTLLLAATAATAQTTRTVRPTELRPELQGELALKNGDYLLLSLQGERSTADYTGRRLGLDARRINVAYEHFWSPKWSWGGALRYRATTGFNLLIPELLVRHRAPIFGGITFGQRLSAELQVPAFNNYVGGSGPDSQLWGRLRVDIEKIIPLGSDASGFALRPRLSYEAYTHLRFQKEENDDDERTIQYTALRGEVGVRVSRNVDFTPWFAYQTYYGTSLLQYDANGNPVRGGNYNDVYPTVGLDLRYTILPAATKADRQQLPTQH